MQNNEIKRLEANSWKGLTEIDNPPANLGGIYTVEKDSYLLKTSINKISPKGLKIINVGGGHGNEAEFLIKNGARELAIVDIAIGQLRTARNRKEKHNLDTLEIILGDAENLPFKDKVFDLGYIYMALHHFPDHYKSINEINRVSRKLLFIDIMNPLITRALNFIGFFKEEDHGIIPNRLEEAEVAKIFYDINLKAKFTYFFIPPYGGNSILLLNLLEIISILINILISKSRKTAQIFGNIAIIEEDQYEDPSCSRV